VPQLVEHSPFSFDDPDRVFVGKKETSIIEIDLGKGIVKSVMSGTNSWLHENGEESEDDWSGGNSRIVQIGRTGEPSPIPIIKATYKLFRLFDQGYFPQRRAANTLIFHIWPEQHEQATSITLETYT
jgi:hypothetical protein